MRLRHRRVPELVLRDGASIAYRDEGRGRPVVFIHGWGGSRGGYAHAIASLTKGTTGSSYRCIAYDQRGHGGSTAPQATPLTDARLAADLEEILDRLGVASDCTLVGWSMGAAVVLRYVALYGCRRLRSVVLVDMAPKLVNDAGWSLGLFRGEYTGEDYDRDVALMARDFGAFYRQFIPRAISLYNRLPRLAWPLMSRVHMIGNSPRVLRELWCAMFETDNRPALAALTVPLAYFYGDPGSLYSPALAEYYRGHVTVPYTPVPFPRGTHSLVTEYPEKFAAELKRFLLLDTTPAIKNP